MKMAAAEKKQYRGFWRGKLRKRDLIGWALMLPSILLFTFFVWWPLGSNIGLSFFASVGFNATRFVGFANYETVFHDPIFLKALLNTLKYVGWSLLIGFVIPIFLGLLLSEVVHFKGFFRTVLYFPSMISGIAVVIMWSYLLDPNAIGPLNAIVVALGGTPFLFLSDPHWVIPLIVITMTWRGAGGTMLVYLSALQTIDNSLYEEARIEGAGFLQRIHYVTIPHILPTIRTLLVLQIISVLQIFYEPLVMTSGGGPNGESESLMLLAYQYAFLDAGTASHASLSSATSVILSALIILFTVVYLAFASKQKKEPENA
jgi:multiple sugar transport system permease protein